MNLKIKTTPRIAEKLNLEGKGFEGLYWIGNHIMLDNGYESILLKKSMNGGIYRKLEENPGDDVPGVVHISTYSPTDFKVHVDYFQLLEEEKHEQG